MMIHILSRHWWVFEESKGKMSLPFVARCGASLVGKEEEGANWTVVDKDNTYSGFHGDVVPTCDACILLDWADPVGTEHKSDYEYRVQA